MEIIEKETFELKEGDVVFRTGRIIHGGWFAKDSLIIDGSAETYLNSDFNDVQEEKIKGGNFKWW